MNLLDAARQALEEWHTEPGSVRMASLMIALRQAIEQAEQQEPIGYVNPRWALEMQQGRLPYTWLHAQPDAEGAVAVYITLPQRKPEPLSDEEIDRVTDQQWASNNHKPIYAAHRAYARAIERAHGITGETNE